MSLLADWKEIRKKGRAEAIRRRITALGLKRRAIQAEQLKLTNEAELLEGTHDVCKIGPDKGQPILTGTPLTLQEKDEPRAPNPAVTQ